MISIVVVAFHRPIELAHLLRGVRGRDREIIVVNVEADPEVSAATVQQGALDVPLSGNLGYAAAVNRGARIAKGDVVVYMNDDLEPEPGAIERLVEPIADGRADVTLPAIVSGEGRRDLGIMALPGVRMAFLELLLLPDRPIPFLRGLGVQKWRAPVVPERVLAGTGALVAVRAALLADQPLPEEYFLYWEEVEWFARLHERGAKVLVVPNAVVVHAGGAADIRPAKARLVMRNAVRCARRTRGRLLAAVVWPAVVGWAARLLATDLAQLFLSRQPSEGFARVRARAVGVTAAILAVTEVFRRW